jgi:hypothetical protein
MVAYVANCTEGMLAVQTAVAMMEGQCAVQYINGEKEKAVATMEGTLRNAWETLKDWIRRAYAAIKKFLKKAWNKMKGYVNVFKAMVTKYAYVLKGKVPSGVKVQWVEIVMISSKHEHIIGGLSQGLVEKLTGEKDERKYAIEDNKNFHKLIESAFFPNGRAPEEVPLTSEILKEAVKVADDGFDKVYSQAFGLGEATERQILKNIQEASDELHDEADKRKSDSAQNKGHNLANKTARLTTNVVRDYCQMVNTAASAKVRYSIKACRAAIRAQAQNSSATYGLESTDFSAVMGEIL